MRFAVLAAVACLSLVPGSAAASFAHGGRVALKLDNLIPRRALAYFGDRTLLIGRPRGSATTLARVGAGGVPDPSFGQDGTEQLDFYIADAAVQSDGRVVVVGYDRAAGEGAPEEHSMLVARLLPNGGLDPSFGKGGIATLDFGRPQEQAQSVAITGGGEIIVGGSSGFSNARTVPEVLVARLRSDGKLDQSFGDGGSVRPVARSNSFFAVEDVASLPGGTIVAALPREDNVLEIVRLGPHGSMRSGPRGRFAVEPPGLDLDHGFLTEPLDQIGVLPDGRVVVVASLYKARRASIAAFRYLPNGRLDPSFGNGGVVRARLRNSAAAFALQRSGRLAIATGMNAAKGTFSILCFDPRGRPDPRFGRRGLAKVDFGLRGWQSRAGALLFGTHGALTVAGVTQSTPSAPRPMRTGLARLRFHPVR